MTIHSDWSRILHDECAEAFSKKAPPCGMKVGIIDGHLQLMRLDARMETWECFIRNQFLKPIQSLFNLGCPRVVLCFDNYSAVPIYKSMTQLARTQKQRHEIKIFNAHDPLPAKVPDDPMLYLMNRNFKIKLIEMLCEKVPSLVDIPRGKEFLLDYKRVVSYQAEHRIPTPVKGMESMGESDVKFCRYVTKYGNALVHAIDGDYMAIALLYYAHHSLHENNKIFIYRQLATLHQPAPPKDSKKRKRLHISRFFSNQEELVFFRPQEARAEEEEPPEKKEPPHKCWVNMQMIYSVITRAMRKHQSVLNPLTQKVYTDQDAVFSAVYLMLWAGTDFSRNIPLIGPKRMWDALPLISRPLMQAVRGEGAVNERMFLNLVIARMYAMNYKKHVPPVSPMTLEGVLTQLQKSKLSEGTKKKLPTEERVLTTLHNLNWVVQYWRMENGIVDTPLDGHFGYAQDVKGNMAFADQLPQ